MGGGVHESEFLNEICTPDLDDEIWEGGMGKNRNNETILGVTLLKFFGGPEALTAQPGKLSGWVH